MLWLSSLELFLLTPAVPSFFYTPTVAQPQHVALLLAKKRVCFHSNGQTVVSETAGVCVCLHTCTSCVCVSLKHTIACSDYRSSQPPPPPPPLWYNLLTVNVWYHSVNTRPQNRCAGDTWVCAAAGKHSCSSHNSTRADKQLLQRWKQRQGCSTCTDTHEQLMIIRQWLFIHDNTKPMIKPGRDIYISGSPPLVLYSLVLPSSYFMLQNALKVFSGWLFWTADRPAQHVDSLSMEQCCCNTYRMWFSNVLLKEVRLCWKRYNLDENIMWS